MFCTLADANALSEPVSKRTRLGTSRSSSPEPRERQEGEHTEESAQAPVADDRQRDLAQRTGVMAMESEAETSDVGDGEMEPLYDLWLAAGPKTLYYKQNSQKSVKATELKQLIKNRKELRGRCTVCDSHPHCGVWGHNKAKCRAVDGDGGKTYVICEQGFDPTGAVTIRPLLCGRCGVFVHDADASRNPRVAPLELVCALCHRSQHAEARRDEAAAAAATQVTVAAAESEVSSGEGSAVVLDGAGAMGPPGQLRGLGLHPAGLLAEGINAPPAHVFSNKRDIGPSKPPPSVQLAPPATSPGQMRRCASTGMSLHRAGVVGLHVVPKEVKGRALHPKDFLPHNLVGGSMDGEGEGEITLVNGALVAKPKKKRRECENATEWGVADLKLHRFYMATNQFVSPQEEQAYVQHHLRVMELAVQKQWPCVLEYDMLVRSAVWEGVAEWSSDFTMQYMTAFMDKAGGGNKSSITAKWCSLCHSADHNAGDDGCSAFTRGSLSESGGGKGGGGGKKRGRWNEWAKGDGGVDNTNGGKGGGARNGGGGDNNHDKWLRAGQPKPEPGDVYSGKFYGTIGGKKTCRAFNMGKCTEPCPHGATHLCSFCKKPNHSSTQCKRMEEVAAKLN